MSPCALREEAGRRARDFSASFAPTSTLPPLAFRLDPALQDRCFLPRRLFRSVCPNLHSPSFTCVHDQFPPSFFRRPPFAFPFLATQNTGPSPVRAQYK
mgnify:CR=1 FL=1